MRLLILLCFLQVGFALPSANALDRAPKWVKVLDEYIATVNANLGQYSKIHQDLDIKTDGGGEVTIFSKKGLPVKVVETIFYSRGPTTTSFYYNDGALVAVTELKEYYYYDLAADKFDLSKIDEEVFDKTIYYYTNGRISFIKEERLISPDRLAYPDISKKEKAFESDIKEWREIIKEK